ncbi:hypothetical protein VTN31DRAFT_155 [Thermomyces dupontii]|uniref:uncharacterized protein n=1 Tax=Talaromyces thermophilus TaxID=28565 RepID=UPI00374298DF
MGNRIPLDYSPPPFPSLHIPVIGAIPNNRQLYYTSDIWRFTLYWTLIIYGGVHLVVAVFAVAMQWRNWKSLRMLWTVPLVYLTISGLEALLAGSATGLLLGAIYEAGNFTMTTWMPLVWAVINILVVILSSFPMQGAL